MDVNALFEQIDQFKNDQQKLATFQDQFQQRIEQTTRSIKARLTTSMVPSLLLDLTHLEVQKLSDPDGIEVSDFAGQVRFLRGLSASIPITSFSPTEDPQTDELFIMCDAAWECLLFREILEGLKTNSGDDRDPRIMFAGMMSMVAAIQGDLMSDDDCNERVRRLFSPFSDAVIEPELGLNVEEIISGFTAVREILRNRMQKTIELMRPVLESWQEFKERSDLGHGPQSIEKYVEQSAMIRNAVQSSAEIDRALLIYRPSDLDEHVNGKGREFLEAFSFKPGTVNKQFTTLFDDDVVRRRPFGRVTDEKYVLFNGLQCVFAPLHRLPECFTNEKQRQKLLRNRDDSLEIQAARLFTDVIEPEQQFTEYYLPLGSNGELFERDLLIVRGDVALIIESKAQALRSVADHRGNVRKIEKDVKTSISKGYDQAISVIQFLRNASGPVPVYGSDKQNKPAVGTVDLSSVTTFIPVVFLDSYFGLISTNLEPWLTPSENEGYPWVVDCDAMTAIVSLISDHSQLIEFIEWRRKLHGIAVNEDETVFAGFFLRHGACEMPEKADLVQLDSNFSNIFDKQYLKTKGAQIDDESLYVGPPDWIAMERQCEELSIPVGETLLDNITQVANHSYDRSHHTQRRREKVGRNSPCPCGSGKKHKKCCGAC